MSVLDRKRFYRDLMYSQTRLDGEAVQQSRAKIAQSQGRAFKLLISNDVWARGGL